MFDIAHCHPFFYSGFRRQFAKLYLYERRAAKASALPVRTKGMEQQLYHLLRDFRIKG
jgi:hypothetical protein